MRAILIDDEPLALQSMGRMLAQNGVTVALACDDPAEALRAAERLEADVAFLDMEMPGMSGLETAERLLTLKPALHIVFVTAYDQYAVEAFELQAVDYLLKPLQRRRLDITLERLRARLAERTGREGNGAAERADAQLPVFCMLQRMSYVTAAGTRLEIPWRTTKARELFAYLLHTRSIGVNKETLADMLWPEIEEEKALTNLHTTVYQIRQTIKKLGIPLGIAYLDGVYRLKRDGLRLDTEIWEAEAAAAAEAAPPTLAELKRMLLSYRGDYLEHEGYPWAESERQRLRIRWLECARLAGERFEAADELTELVGLLHQVRARFPLLEEIYFRLMQIHHRLGQSGEVRGEYRLLTEMLRDHLGLPPREEIREWYRVWQTEHEGSE